MDFCFKVCSLKGKRGDPWTPEADGVPEIVPCEGCMCVMGTETGVRGREKEQGVRMFLKCQTWDFT